MKKCSLQLHLDVVMQYSIEEAWLIGRNQSQSSPSDLFYGLNACSALKGNLE